ncbi:MAG: helix-turn-helix transcriptional regulator [Lachnospiraceae bacterium]|nr:helix-turn-helix transcriptional regulator [Lachnospiraceae bacterium]
MILAEKIMMLRKKSGWSQEELADQLQVSRQSVSKWESGASIPDLDKIIKISALFGVSTDYLLKDELETVSYADSKEEPEQGRSVSVEEANEYMTIVKRSARRIAPAVSLCVLSPICLILLAGMSQLTGSKISESLAAAVGVAVLLVMVAVAVGVMILSGLSTDKYSYLEKETLCLEYGVQGIVEKKKKEFEKTFYTCIAVGVMCCILGVVPLVVIGAVAQSELAGVICVAVLLAMIAIGVFFFVWSGIIWGGFEKLLQQGDYTTKNKEFERRFEFVPVIYWCAAAAIYLGISFTWNNWGQSWIIWPVAGVLFGMLMGIMKAVFSRKEE